MTDISNQNIGFNDNSLKAEPSTEFKKNMSGKIE